MSKIYEMRYKGLSTVPSDYDSVDGELSTCLNLINEDGSLKPILSGKKLFSLSRAGERVVYIHKMAGLYTHYIIKYGNQLLYRTDTDPTEILILTLPSDTTIIEVNSVGNSIVILASDGVYYCLWKNNSYKYLGEKPPEIDISFSLLGDIIETSGKNESLSSDFLNKTNVTSGIYKTDVTTSKDDIDSLTNSVMSIVNKMVAEAKRNNNFTFPFYVRYAYRMFDGSYIMQSVPILMIPSTTINPIVVKTTNLSPFGFNVVLSEAQLQMFISEIEESLYDWSDIITSLDIFVSDQFCQYDESGSISTIYGSNYIDIANTKFKKSFAMSMIKILTGASNFDPTAWQFKDLKFFIDDKISNTNKNAYIDLPNKDGFDVKNVGEPMVFYLFKSFDIGRNRLESELERMVEASATLFRYQVLNVGSNYLTNITQKETLIDDYYSHDNIIAKHSYVYNKRLNLANIERLPFTNVPGNWLSCHSDGIWKGHPQSTNSGVFGDARQLRANVYINHDGVDYVVTYSQVTLGDLGGFFFYPNPDAYKIILIRTRDISESDYSTYPRETCTLSLKRHPYLNGAYYFNSFEDLTWTSTSENMEVSENTQTYKLHNLIYTSVVSNPFCFLAEGINSVGLGEIFGIRSAAKALSPGQYGMFPLYAFCDDGVWALEVSSTGIYKAIQPISGDICLGSDSIVQIDNSVMFLTSRGLMLISGSHTQCVSLSLDNDIKNNSLPYFYSVIQDSISNNNMFACNFQSFIKNAFITYDYNHQRIVIFSKDTDNYPFSFVYSLKSKLWSMMDSNFLCSVNTYPSSYVMTKDLYLVDISDSTGGSVSTQLVVTRPIKIELPDNYKTIYSLLQRGIINGEVKTVLYGSRDLESWFAISSSTSFDIRGIGGTGYKYFIIVSLLNMDKNGRLSGASLTYAPRMINRLR